MQIKGIMWCHLPTHQKKSVDRYTQGPWFLSTAVGSVSWYNHLENYLTVSINGDMCVVYDTAISLLNIYPKEMTKSVH